MGLIRFIKESIREGYEEAKQEHQQELELYQQIKQEPISLEKMAIALACPFREILMSTNFAGNAPHLYKLGMLTDKEKADTRQMLEQNFAITDATDFQNELNEMAEITFSIAENCQNNRHRDNPDYVPMYTAMACISLFQILAGIDVEYMKWEKAQPYIDKLVNSILQLDELNSWDKYASYVLKGEEEMEINGVLGRKVIKLRINWLLTDEESPWINMPWNQLY